MLIVLPLTILQFYINKASILLITGKDPENIVNNMAYSFVFLIPFLFFLKNRKITSLIVASIIMIFIIQGAKRGAVVTGIASMSFFLFYQFTNINKKHRIKSIVVTLMGIIVIVFLGIDFIEKNQFLVQRMQSISEGNSSGRDIIYSNLFNAWSNSNNPITLLFGFGFGKTILLSGTGTWAHNDWLELLINFGFLGVLVYLTLFLSSVMLLFNENWSKDKKLLLLSIMSIWFITSMISMNYMASDSLYQSIALGYIIGSNNKTIE